MAARVRQNQNWTLYGKTGWAQAGGGNTGWVVGWVDTKDNTWFFATNIESRNANGPGFGPARKAITMDVLKQLDRHSLSNAAGSGPEAVQSRSSVGITCAPFFLALSLACTMVVKPC